jgi:o-succinylbenzoate---CoA ligase
VSERCPVAVSSERHPHRIALEFGGRTWTWLAVDQEVARWKEHLSSLGIGPGRTVATLSWNRPELVFLLFALGRLGARLVPLNARLTAVELAPLVARSKASLVFADESLVERVDGARPFPRLGDSNDLQPTLATWDPTAELAALFTSGTTGVPSLVPLTGSNFLAASRANAANLGASQMQVWLGTLPLFHVGGLAMAFRCAVMGARLVLEPSFDAHRAAALLARGDVTHASFVPTALVRVLDALTQPVAPALQAILVGGGPMGAALLARARSLGLPVLQTYGLTEACSQVTTERPADADGTTAGHPLEGLEVRVLDEGGAPRPEGEVGEVHVRGGTVTPVAGEWLQTKDLGSLDSYGRLTIHARRVDLIVSGGENVYPAEVEAVLLESGLVKDVAVAPRADALWGQVPVAFVVWRDEPKDEALLSFAASRLAAFKVPKAVVSLTELPRNANGKVVRQALVSTSSPA